LVDLALGDEVAVDLFTHDPRMAPLATRLGSSNVGSGSGIRLSVAPLPADGDLARTPAASHATFWSVPSLAEFRALATSVLTAAHSNMRFWVAAEIGRKPLMDVLRQTVNGIHFDVTRAMSVWRPAPEAARDSVLDAAMQVVDLSRSDHQPRLDAGAAPVRVRERGAALFGFFPAIAGGGVTALLLPMVGFSAAMIVAAVAAAVLSGLWRGPAHGVATGSLRLTAAVRRAA
jgi:hypothetical protein